MKSVWRILWALGKADLRLLWFALHHADRPAWLRPVTVALALYAVAPFNFVLPLLGIVDDMVLIPLVLHWLLKLLPLPVQQEFASRSLKAAG